MDGDEIQTKFYPFTHHFGKQRKEETKCACANILVPRSFHNPDDSSPVLPKSSIAWLEIPRDSHMFFFPTLQAECF